MAVQKQNYPHISFIKNIAILLVILFHAICPFSDSTNNYFWKEFAYSNNIYFINLVKSFLNSFLVPSLFLCSGFLCANSLAKNRKIKSEIIKKVKRLLFPYLCVSVLFLVPMYYIFNVSAFNRPGGTSLLETYILSLTGRFTDHLWYILVLFWIDLIFILLSPAFKKINYFITTIIIIIAAILLANYANSIIYYGIWEIFPNIFFFYLGYSLYVYKEQIYSKINKNKKFLFPAEIIMIIILSKISIPWYISSLFYAFIAYTSLYIFCENYSKYFIESKCYKYLDANSFYFYIFHLPIELPLFKVLNAYRLPVAAIIFLDVSITVLLILLLIRVIKFISLAVFHPASDIR